MRSVSMLGSCVGLTVMLSVEDGRERARGKDSPEADAHEVEGIRGRADEEDLHGDIVQTDKVEREQV